MTKQAKQTKLGGTFALPGAAANLYRMGYGAMQLAGPEVWGPPRDVEAAIAVYERRPRLVSTIWTPATITAPM